MKTITLSSKNQVVVPSAVRARLGIKGGDRLVVDRITDTTVTLKKELKYADLVGILSPQKPDAVSRVRKIRDGWE